MSSSASPMGLVPRKVLQNAQPHVCVCVGHSGKAPCGSDAAVFELGKPTANPTWLQVATAYMRTRAE
jgi:hypothetical protein